jgi:hypothetical protein
LTDLVALISPYSNHTLTRTLNSEDSIYASANGSVTLVSVTQNSANNYTGIVTLGVNSTAIPDVVDSGETGPGIGLISPNGSNVTMPTGVPFGDSPPGGRLTQTTSLSATTVISATTTTTTSNGLKLTCLTLFFMILVLFSIFI